MPPYRLLWTEANDLKLRRLRAEGSTWDAIADALGVSRWTAIERGRKLGARRPPPEFKPRPNLARDPLPAGHAESWGLLNAGTSLEGAAYPVRAQVRAAVVVRKGQDAAVNSSPDGCPRRLPMN